MIRLAFSGSRSFTDEKVVWRLFEGLIRDLGRFEVSVGDAKSGLDPMVARIAKELGLPVRVEICHWPPANASAQEKRWAAHERNGRVVRGCDTLFAFYGPDGPTPGTSDAIGWANHAKIEKRVYHQAKGTWR